MTKGVWKMAVDGMVYTVVADDVEEVKTLVRAAHTKRDIVGLHITVARVSDVENGIISVKADLDPAQTTKDLLRAALSQQ